MDVWYYVEGKDKIGPIEEQELRKLYSSGILHDKSYVWKKGFDNWKIIGEVDELADLGSLSSSLEEVPDFVVGQFDWDKLDFDDKIFTVKIGRDRGLSEDIEYGPYSLNIIKKLLDEKRVTPKTFIFAPGMENWIFIADIPIYEQVFATLPPTITDEERRKATRKPFVARIFFHNNEKFFDGVCRDISIGGMQVLVSNYSVKPKDVISLNVHPENSEYGFVASGEVVRLLDGGQGFSIRFKNLSDKSRQSIEKYIQESF
jgi:hypothetical protein